jgi:hypothetical protein
VANSRDWVCVRLASYEEEKEGEYLTQLYRGRTGLLNNTTFALLAPDGETLLAPSGRGPQFVLGKRGNPDQTAATEDVAAFAEVLATKAQGFAAKADIALLPEALDVRRALVVAACDNQPLVVLYAASEQAKRSAKAQLAELAWSEEFLGRVQYIVATSREELSQIAGLPEGDFVAVVEPNQFGLEGKVLASLTASAKNKELAQLLRQGLQSYTRVDLPSREHRQQGRRAKATWESVMPVTDEGKAPRRG